jgi:hypothetical protein
MCDGIGSGDTVYTRIDNNIATMTIYILYTNQSGDYHNAIQYSDSKCDIYIYV